MENIALHKFAAMSSQFSDSKPSRGVDGNTEYTLVHTATNRLPAWYYVDLGETARVKHIRILNRYGQREFTEHFIHKLRLENHDIVDVSLT